MVETLPDAIVKAMFAANSDGCGIVTPSFSYKGLSLNTLLKKLHERDINEPCLMHFRWATHGSICRANCHPFRDSKSGCSFMHNGILNIVPVGNMTDSETAFLRYFVPEIRKHGLDSDELAYAVHQVIGSSKFAFLQGDTVRLFGEYLKWNGSWFSNLRFRYYIR